MSVQIIDLCDSALCTCTAVAHVRVLDASGAEQIRCKPCSHHLDCIKEHLDKRPASWPKLVLDVQPIGGA